MTMDPQSLRIEGVYQQRQEGYFMQRVKLAAGVISSDQARCVAAVSERFGRGTLHLTSRGSMEVHWLQLDDLPLVKQEFARTGLTSRGACGGAVRGVTCSSQDSHEFPQLESLARRIQRHFTGNPRFEKLPKKFKVGLEACITGGRHLIQDVGLVLAGNIDGVSSYDVWIAGGLGREPQAGFLLEEKVAENRLIPVIEAIIRVYGRLAPPPRRLKYLTNEMGEERLRQEIEAEPTYREELPQQGGFSENLTPPFETGRRLTFPAFAGQLTTELLRKLADFADRHGGGLLQVTVDQDLAFVLGKEQDATRAALELAELYEPPPAGPAIFRICPGNHECRMGLAPTRLIAEELIKTMDPEARGLSWALSGCSNSCSQPQLADMGLIVSKLVAGEDGGKEARFDMYRRKGAGLGEKVRENLTIAELTEQVKQFTG